MLNKKLLNQVRRKKGDKMKIGAFSVSLSVKDINASKTFYETLGFESFGGDIDQKWLIMKNGEAVIGIFEGMFEGNMMTFNPGWTQDAQDEAKYTDVRELEKKYKEADITFISETDESLEGPANFMIEDPDGNKILFDQHR